MIDPAKIESALKQVYNQTSFVQSLLIDALGWPVDEAAQEIGDIAYEWTEDELRAAGLNEKIVGGKAYQIILPGNPWGIFVMEFANPDVFTTGRGMTGVLRRVLHGLVRKGQGGQSSNLPRFTQDNLLFICNHDYERYRFAHFKAAPEGSSTAPMTSFGWGPDDLDAVRTICEFNLRALEWPDATPASEAEWLRAWAPAFDVEKVTKRFYEDYRNEFERVEDIIRKTKAVKDDELRLFTQSLFNRLMFLRFIERKGWLKFPGQTGSRYLATLASAGGIGKQSLYASRLRPLFFEGLAEEGKQQAAAFGQVPLLNGGLFEKAPLDDKVTDIPDDAFAPIINQGGLFYRYNFTVEESTPLDIEVAVDPEMLGKVFEELVTGRHESGSYYTPRPVVAFMCREALKGHLADRTKAPEQAIAKLVDDHVVEGLTEAHAKAIIDALDNLKAVDPACGSGAYLLGLLQELVAIRRAMQSDKLAADPGFLYDLKLHIISHNLYGVDIDPFATEIAKLRLWLSLAVEADHPVPLPNLDFKIETGDALLGPDPGDISDLFQLELNARADALVNKKNQFLQAHGARKTKLRQEIIAAENLIRQRLDQHVGPGIIDWRVQFAEVFAGSFAAAGGGFDIVMANPPYVRQELIKDQKPALKKVYGDLFSGTADLYVFFYLRALQLLAPDGMLVFISSNKWFRAGYGEKLRAHLAKTTTVQTIVDFHDLPVFESAIAYPMIFTAAKRTPPDTHTATLAEPPDLDPPYPDVKDVVTKYGHKMPTTALGRDGTWHLATSGAADLLAKMRKAGPTLREVSKARVYRGLTTGLNEAFVIDRQTRDALIAEDKCAGEIIKPYAGGRDLNRWCIDESTHWIIVTRIGTDMRRYPAVMTHLKQFQNRLEVRDDQGEHWWELRACAYYDEFEKPKILSTKVSIRPTFSLDIARRYLGNTTYFLSVDDKAARFLLAVLNSSASAFFAKSVFVGKQSGWYEVQPPQLENMPIPTASAADRSAIGALAQKCLDAKGVGCEAWEKEIDERVAGLYGIELKDIARLNTDGLAAPG